MRALPAASLTGRGGARAVRLALVTTARRNERRTSRYRPVRVAWLVGSLVVLAVGVAMLLASRLGADGYSTLINGLTIASGWPFALVTILVAAVFIGAAWARGLRPDIGTVLQPVIVGLVVGALLPVLPSPGGVGALVEFALGFAVICVGVAGYLSADLGIGPTESAPIAFDPPVPFRWSYMAVQVLGCLLGFACGADVGLGTLLVVFGISPVVDRLRGVMPRWV